MATSHPKCLQTDRFERIEKALEKVLGLVEQHLIESGNVKTDLVWLKRGVGICAGAALSSVGAFLVALVMFILRK